MQSLFIFGGIYQWQNVIGVKKEVRKNYLNMNIKLKGVGNEQ